VRHLAVWPRDLQLPLTLEEPFDVDERQRDYTPVLVELDAVALRRRVGVVRQTSRVVALNVEV
jgi:hypothetical protein